MRRKFILYCLAFILSYTGVYADNPPLYSFNKSDMIAMNANSLLDVLRYLPLISSVSTANQQVIRLGTESLAVSAVYKDGFPLFMDQNIPMSYNSIALNDIERIEIRLPDISSGTKGITGVNIYLFTQGVHLKPLNYSLTTSLNSLSDACLSASTSLSDSRHSVGLFFSRYFENGINAANSRLMQMPSFTNHSIGVKYHYRFLRNSGLSVDYSLRQFNQIAKDSLFAGTSRSQDYNTTDLMHRLNAKLNMKLSKNHRLALSGQYNKIKTHSYVFEKDLYSGQSEKLAVNNLSDSVNNQQIYIKSLFSKIDSINNYSYSLGIEYSNFKDLNNKSIDAIPVSYNDYILTGNVEYQPHSSINIGAGIGYLSNSVLGTYVLPRFFLSLRPSDKLHAELRHLSSVMYPSHVTIFYSAEKRNSALENNLKLEAGRYTINHMFLQLREGRAFFESGLLYANISNGVKADFDLKTFTNARQASTLTTYFSFNYSGDNFNFKPILAIKSNNDIKDVISQYLYTPEFSFKASYTMQKANMNLFVFAKMSGSTRRFQEDEGEVFELRVGSYSLVNIACSKMLAKNRIALNVGVNNLLNTFLIDYSKYTFNDFESTRISTNDAFASRKRNFFISLALKIE